MAPQPETNLSPKPQRTILPAGPGRGEEARRTQPRIRALPETSRPARLQTDRVHLRQGTKAHQRQRGSFLHRKIRTANHRSAAAVAATCLLAKFLPRHVDGPAGPAVPTHGSDDDDDGDYVEWCSAGQCGGHGVDTGEW
uniref:(northern house mosquito) hypothetical protein n=1 Tax=Culex pipiens TaxID=7175 RepID=A0A8D8IYT7_CULPI